MKYTLRVLPRAERDAQQIYAWLVGRSPAGAARWFSALDDAARKVVQNPARYGLAPEDEHVTYELRQFLFKTRHGRTYRGVFTVVGGEVRVLRVRGPGQAPLTRDELEE